jgi:UDP-2,3-diacylglucosamine hydrolase
MPFGTIRHVQAESKPIYWISDAHLGSAPNPLEREARLVRFLNQLRGQTEQLYIVGDLFDFWFEYRHAVPRGGFRALHAIAGLVDSGTHVSYLGGNHDFWCGTYLAREVGLDVRPSPITVEHQGRRIFLAHGDGLGPGDTGYRMLKAVLRNPAAIALYRWLHPDLGIPLAHRVSAVSRVHTKGRDPYLMRMSRHVASPQYAQGHDVVLVGHVHDPMHLRDDAGREFLVIGDWIDAFSFVRLAAGRFSLLRFVPGSEPVPIPATAWPEGMAPGRGQGSDSR